MLWRSSFKTIPLGDLNIQPILTTNWVDSDRHPVFLDGNGGKWMKSKTCLKNLENTSHSRLLTVSGSVIVTKAP